MFTAYCPAHEAAVLLPLSRMRALRNTAQGIELRFACWCGTSLEILTGVTAEEPAPASA